MEAIAGALGSSLQEVYDRWHEWAARQCGFVIGNKPGITNDEYDDVARRFAEIGIELLPLSAATSTLVGEDF